MNTKSHYRPECSLLTAYLAPDSGGNMLPGEIHASIFGSGASPSTDGELVDDEDDGDDEVGDDSEAEYTDDADDTEYDGSEDGDDTDDGEGEADSQVIPQQMVDPGIATVLAKFGGDPLALAQSYRHAEQLIGSQGQQLGQLNQQNAALQQLSNLLLANATQPQAQQQAPAPEQAPDPDEFLAALAERGPAAVTDIVQREFAKIAQVAAQQQAVQNQRAYMAQAQAQQQEQQAAAVFVTQAQANDQRMQELMASDPQFAAHAPLMSKMLDMPQFRALMGQGDMQGSAVDNLYLIAQGVAARAGAGKPRQQASKGNARAYAGTGRYVETQDTSLERKIHNSIFPRAR